MTGVTLDAGALIALDRNVRAAVALLARAHERGARVTVPATALAQAMRNPARQAVLSRLVRQPTTDVAVLDRAGATAVGALLAATNTRDIADAHVVLCAARARQAIVTTEAGELRRLAPRAAIVAL